MISDGWGEFDESAYRKHSQEGSFPSILQADHCYIHFGCPMRSTPMVNASPGDMMSFSCPVAHTGSRVTRICVVLRSIRRQLRGDTYQKRRNSQS